MQQLCFKLYPLITSLYLSCFFVILMCKYCKAVLLIFAVWKCLPRYKQYSKNSTVWFMVYTFKMSSHICEDRAKIESVSKAFCIYQRGPDHAVKYPSVWFSHAWQIGTRTQRRQSLESHMRTKSKLNGCLGVSTAYTSHKLTAWFWFFCCCCFFGECSRRVWHYNSLFWAFSMNNTP